MFIYKNMTMYTTLKRYTMKRAWLETGTTCSKDSTKVTPEEQNHAGKRAQGFLPDIQPVKINFSVMINLPFLRSGLLTAILLAGFTLASRAQKMSFSSAYNILNTGSKYSNSKPVNMQAGAVSLNNYNYTSKVKLSYGIPTEIVFEYAIVKARMGSDLASDPETYNNSSENVQQAFINLAYGDFVKISDYHKVNVKLNFQFNPARLVVYGSDAGDFLNNSNSSPWDVGVYKAPSTPVSGSKIMVIQ